LLIYIVDLYMIYQIYSEQLVIIKITLITVCLVEVLSLYVISLRFKVGCLSDVVPWPIKVNDMREFSKSFSFGPVFVAIPNENHFGYYNFL
jgi:hypothetical protein